MNEAPVVNELGRQFEQGEARKVIVPDLTYVRVGGKWHYVCFILDLFNREIIGHSAGTNKTADLLKEAIYQIPSTRFLFHFSTSSFFIQIAEANLIIRPLMRF